MIGVKLLPKGIPYRVINELQNFMVEQHMVNNLLLVEHPPTYTVGRRIKSSDEESYLKSLGADFVHSQRGGEITFHGPGQLVGYPILDLRDYDLKARAYICALQKSLISTCNAFDVETSLNEHTGVWVKDKKIAALGVKIQRHITSHGFALNCNTDLAWFDKIVPCGLRGFGVTSLSKEKSRDIPVEEVIPVILEAFGKTFNSPMGSMSAETEMKVDMFLKSNLNKADS